jgi:hypothetical protein
MSWFEDQARFNDYDVVPLGAMPVFWYIPGGMFRCSWYGCAYCDRDNSYDFEE